MLHLTKLAVGVRDIAHLQCLQAERAGSDPPLRHRTRNFPRRAAEITPGGSMYWVVCGVMLVRQRVLDIAEDRWDDGSRCAGLLLDPVLVRIEGRRVRPFQGWRYLLGPEAPPDLGSPEGGHSAGMPDDLRRGLRELCLL